MGTDITSDPALAAAITRTASRQTYYTVRFLVDRELVDDAYRAYAYFRWLDDLLDGEALSREERLDFVRRQQALIDGGYGQQPLAGLTPEERMVAELIQRDREEDSGLQAYLRNMMAVMAFDASRRGQHVSQQELNEYTLRLAVAVTEALHYFIGHGSASPLDETRYLAVTGAHLAHMLRDAAEDARAGYYNIPRDLIAVHGKPSQKVESEIYRDWARETSRKARACFLAGRDYLARVESLRCRIAGYAYIRRFEATLACIERNGYVLQAEYPERQRGYSGAETIGWALCMALTCRPTAGSLDALPPRRHAGGHHLSGAAIHVRRGTS